MTNEAPEKIHIGIRPSEFGGSVLTTVDKDFPNAVEYTHTDAFIEKACKYLEPIIFSMNLGDRPDMDKFIGDFKKYMKGE